MGTKCEENKPEDSTECKKDYELMPLTKKCHKPKTCEDGKYYHPIIHQCMKCPKECTKCEDASSCTECKNSILPIEGICENGCPPKQELVNGKCTDILIIHCNNSSDKDCIKCQTNFSLNIIDKKCYEECPKGTYSDKKGKCLPCKEECAESNLFLIVKNVINHLFYFQMEPVKKNALTNSSNFA